MQANMLKLMKIFERKKQFIYIVHIVQDRKDICYVGGIW